MKGKKAQGVKWWIVGLIIAVAFLLVYLIIAEKFGLEIVKAGTEVTRRFVGL